MPYGISKAAGGDSPENVSKMESCVKKVLNKNKGKKGFKKVNAIRICKNSLFKAAKLREK